MLKLQRSSPGDVPHKPRENQARSLKLKCVPHPLGRFEVSKQEAASQADFSLQNTAAPQTWVRPDPTPADSQARLSPTPQPLRKRGQGQA